MMMRILFSLALTVGLMAGVSGQAKKYQVSQHKDASGYHYETISNDPLQGRIYTLNNGLKVFLTHNPDEPRVQTFIGIRAGSAHDPANTTGLAHYFEHMMFKGSSRIGTLDWDKEKVLLDSISALFEAHRRATDPATKKAIYRQIDSLSVVAARYAIPNEYDKMVSALGAKQTNAGTALDYTVYINDIPSNEFERWAMLESERFENIVLRLFHTELETVYEEFNMYQDRDRSRANAALMDALFEAHPYGRAIIGLPEHLKNPSMVNIHEFAKMYYRPNNMAISISGDVDFDRFILILDRYFGKMKPGNLARFAYAPEAPITTPRIREVYGPDAENLTMAFRFQGDNTPDHRYIRLISALLSNQKAGLIDLNLNQQQKVLNAGSGAYALKDYGMLMLYGSPRQGQSLEEVRDLLLAEIEKIKRGDFEEWLIQAVINDMRLSEIRQLERNYSRAYKYMDAFFKEVPYDEKLTFLDEMEKIRKEDIMQFARQHLKNNYAIVFKRQGEPTNIIKVDKPEISAIDINRDSQSEFMSAFLEMPAEKLEPVFLDFEKEIQNRDWQPGINLQYIHNKTNELFSLYYIIDMGRNHDPRLALAIDYLQYLGTSHYGPSALQQELFKHGLSFSVRSGNDRCYVHVSGLEKSFAKGMELLEHILGAVKPDEKAYQDLVEGILKERANAKANSNTIMWQAMFNYGKYGHRSPFTNVLPEVELRRMPPAELVRLIQGLTSFRHRVFYYGSSPIDHVEALLAKYHKPSTKLIDIPEPVHFDEQPTDYNKVYVVDYDMVQVNILMLNKRGMFEERLIPPASLFGEYFGRGLSSIVFQEIRESKGLAYSAFSSFSLAPRIDESNYLYAFVGTQADKMETAILAMLGLMNEMPKAKTQFDLAKESIQKRIETERIARADVFWTYQRYLDQGINRDMREETYHIMQHITLDEFAGFFDEQIKGNHYTFLILGKRDNLDLNMLRDLGELRELSLEEIFGY